MSKPEVEDAAEVPVALPSSEPVNRDSIRAKIFGSKSRTVTIDFFGTQIELRQPKMGTILAMRRGESTLDAAQMMLIHYAYLPGTDERVFDEADIDAIDELPFGEDMQRFTVEVAKLMGQDPEELQKQVEEAAKSA